MSILRQLADALAEAAGCRERPLFVARDESSAWVWLPLGSRNTIARDPLEKVLTATSGGQARAALGEPAPAVDGFRRTQRQALSAQLVALSSTQGRVTLTPEAATRRQPSC